MKTAIIGATGFVGSSLVKEFANRKHDVTAISRNPAKDNTAGVQYTNVNVYDTDALCEAIKGQDIVISAFNPGWANPDIYEDFLRGAKSIQEAVKKSGVKRCIIIGGAGSLYITPDVQVVDTPEFPQEIKAGASAARDYLDILRNETELDWVFFSPALEMHPGITTGRTGTYRLGLENPVFDNNGRSILSVEDLAVVIADEAENHKHNKQRFTAGY